MNVIHLLCASHFLHVQNVSVFPCVNVDARRTSDQRQSNARHKWSTSSKFVVLRLTEVCPSHTYTAHSARIKK